MELTNFLTTVVTSQYPGNLILARGDGSYWQEEAFPYPQALERGDVEEYIAEWSPKTNVYFSPVLYTGKLRRREFVIPTRTISQDLDEAPLDTVPISATLLLSTSRGQAWQRHQGFWILKEEEGYPSLEALEILSRKLAYATPGCDTSGWPLTRVVRLPNTYNHKYLEGPQPVLVAQSHEHYYSLSELELLPEVPALITTEVDDAWLESPPHLDYGPQELFNAIQHQPEAQGRIPARVITQYNVQMPDRSAALWVLMLALFRCGVPRDYVFWLAKHSANNKFADLRYYADRELAKDVLRAERVARVDTNDARTAIATARRVAGHLSDKRSQIYRICFDDMQARGEFIHTQDQNCYYVRGDLGRPVLVSTHSEYLDMLLDVYYGLNRTEAEQTYIASSLLAYSKTLPANGTIGALSHYMADPNTMLLHTGKREVLVITKDGVTPATNGSYGVVFPWLSTMEPFAPRLNEASTDQVDWGEIIYGRSLKHVLEMKSSSAQALLKVWTIFILFRSASVSRPILALFGQPACLSGDTVVHVRYRTTLQSMTLEMAYKRFTDPKLMRGHPMTIASLQGSRVREGKIANIVYSGVKRTYVVKIGNREPIRATLDHQFLTPTGYRKLGNLAPGVKVVVRDYHTVNGWKYATIKSVEHWGEEPTYDIQMEDEEAPNFLVNGVVVHNSGKSTIFRKIYSLFYGGKRALQDATTGPDSFDQATVNNPLVVLDNLDTYEKWIPDRLALAAANSDFDKRKLWTDVDVVTQRRQAVVAVSAHNPRFGREDVMDRLLLITLGRYDKGEFRDETTLITEILEQRNVLWGSIVSDVVKVLRTPIPPASEVPHFRVQDFARIGLRIARGIGCEEDFRDAIDVVGLGTKAFILSEETVLVEAIKNFVAQDMIASEPPSFAPIGKLYARLEAASGDATTFTRYYRSANALAKKLWVLQTTLKQIIDCEWEYDSISASRKWKLSKKTG